MPRSVASCVLACCLFAHLTARADITVEGTVHYWNGDVENSDKTTGAYVPAKFLQVQVETDRTTVGDIDTWTDAEGKYKVTFKQKIYRPDFGSLKVNVEVRACVLLDTVKRDWAMDVKNTISVCKGAVRLYPYNGQTRAIEVQDGNTVTINVYVAPPDKPYAETSMGARYNLPIASWDYDDNGRRTLAGIFLCQTCAEAYRFLCDRAADEKELVRKTIIFYPEAKSAYRDTQSPAGFPKLAEGAGWIDMRSRKLFADERPEIGTWAEWRWLRCTMLHEFSHKLMHDVYWTMPKTHPWMSSEHDPTSCDSGEMGWREGWAQFLPAAVIGLPTMGGEPSTTGGLPRNIEHAWFPNPPGMDGREGLLTWRDIIEGRRDWNEIEVAAVLWDIYDPRGWEYMPKAQQDKKPAGWPGHLTWFDRLTNPNLDRIWKIVKKQPEALNDEDETVMRDSFWTFWLEEYGKDKELVHGLKAVLHNRDIRHTLRPENKPEIQSIRIVSDDGFAQLKVKEPDAEDRPFLYYNVAYAKGAEPLKLLHTKDQLLVGTLQDDVLTALVRLPARSAWTRLVLLVHDSMDFDSTDETGPEWEKGDGTGGPKVRLLAAGNNRSAAVRDDGTIWTWGAGMPSYRYAGLLGEKKDAAVRCAGPVRETWGFVAIACGYNHTVALRYDGTVWVWGTNYHGVLAFEEREPKWYDAPMQVPNLSDVVAISAGLDYTLALRSNGELWAWGYNGSGQLADGTTTDRSAPAKIAGLPVIATMAAGDTHTLAVDRDGNVWAWGANGRGQLGDGAEVRQHAPDHLTPAKVVGIDKVAAVACHGWHSLALKADGTVWEWGVRESSSVKYPTTSVPVQVNGLNRITAISSGGGFHVSLRDDGAVWSWGEVHWCGQLGCGPLDEKPVDWGMLRQVKNADGPLTDVIAISTGTKHTVALRSDGSVWAWGGDEFHCLGQGSSGHQSIAVRVKKFESTGKDKDAYSVTPFNLSQD